MSDPYIHYSEFLCSITGDESKSWLPKKSIFFLNLHIGYVGIYGYAGEMEEGNEENKIQDVEEKSSRAENINEL